MTIKLSNGTVMVLSMPYKCGVQVESTYADGTTGTVQFPGWVSIEVFYENALRPVWAALGEIWEVL